MAEIECGGFLFYNKFDSANLLKVALATHENNASTHTTSSHIVNKSVTTEAKEIPEVEFNIWTRPDCEGTEFENANRTWFYFGIKSPKPSIVMRLNIVNLNRQGKMYSQGMTPVYRILPGKPQWERIRDKPLYNMKDNVFTLSFKFKTSENVDSIAYFAFTYPFPYNESQKMLASIDERFLKTVANCEDDIYYKREVVSYSLEGREINLITITSYHGITSDREDRLKFLFPNEYCIRPYKFQNKPIIFISARVHPGETPSTFVFNGFLNLLITRDDPIAVMLRRLYVFKMIPILNPDGVALGHYRTDTRGVNLNRVYLNPNLLLHPPIYAARALIRYYHYGYEKEETEKERQKLMFNDNISKKVSNMSLDEKYCRNCKSNGSFTTNSISTQTLESQCQACGIDFNKIEKNEYYKDADTKCNDLINNNTINNNDSNNNNTNNNESMSSGIFLYIDMHGHASKKGIFMYGNHFENIEKNVECMLLPKLMSINNFNFHFTACNFTERNMYLKDKRDGMSREGSGRVAVLKLTGLTKSYTLECNYNTGRLVNVLPPSIREPHGKPHSILIPPKYTPHVFEEVGKSLGASILDLTGQNPHTRLPNSEFHSLHGLKEWLTINCANCLGDNNRIPVKNKLSDVQDKGYGIKGRPATAKSFSKKYSTKQRPSTTVSIESKESVDSSDSGLSQPGCSQTDRRQRMKNLDLKPKSIKDFSVKYRNRNKVPKNPTNNKIELNKTKSDQVDCLRFKEICFVKTNEGKTVITKLKNANNINKEAYDKNLVIPWNYQADLYNPTVYRPIAGTSNELNPQNYAKRTLYAKSKIKKHNLRRLTNSSVEVSSNVEVRRRKKHK